MALRAKKPESIQKRLKLLMFSPAGVGKSTASAQFPNAYFIDGEKGTENYSEILSAAGSQVFHTTDLNEVVTEVKSLLVEKHEFRTLVIDPISTLYADLLAKCELKVGSDHGRHYGEADKVMRRLANLIMSLDMNVVVTAHAKVEYGDNFKKLGFTFDGWKRLDYLFDLVVQLSRDESFDPNKPRAKSNKRFARVEKTRLPGFPDGEVFSWSYSEIAKRYGGELLERAAIAVQLATAEQVTEIKSLLEVVRLPDGTVEKWLTKAKVDDWEDMPSEAIVKCIEFVKSRIPAAA